MRGDCYMTCNIVTRPFGEHISTSQANHCRWRRNGFRPMVDFHSYSGYNLWQETFDVSARLLAEYF